VTITIIPAEREDPAPEGFLRQLDNDVDRPLAVFGSVEQQLIAVCSSVATSVCPALMRPQPEVLPRRAADPRRGHAARRARLV
jgi:hypothetical protein